MERLLFLKERVMKIKAKTTRAVELTGLTEILFDRYMGNNTKLSPEQKLYLTDDNVVCLPSANILSFLTAQNTDSAPKLLLGKRAKGICSALLSSIAIMPTTIPFTRKGKPIVFEKFQGDVDAKSGIRIVRHVARLPKGIPNPKERPLLAPPWTLSFDMMILPHPELTFELIENLFIDGGVRLGLGTFRKAFGKFSFAWK